MRRPHRLLFVCHGNICRSPMAEALARSHAGPGSPPELFRSAGFSPGLQGKPYHPVAVECCEGHGVHLTGKSRAVGEKDLEEADYVFAMDRSTLGMVWGLEPSGRFAPKLYLLGEFGPERDRLEIADPLLTEEKDFEKLFHRISACTRGLLGALDGLGEGQALPASRATSALEGDGEAPPSLLGEPAVAGWLVPLIRGKSVLALGIDAAEEAKLAAVAGKVTRVLVAATRTPQWPPPERFDVVLAGNVFPRVLSGRREHFLRGISACLGNGGRAVLAFPTERGPDLLGPLRATFSSVKLAGSGAPRGAAGRFLLAVPGGGLFFRAFPSLAETLWAVCGK